MFKSLIALIIFIMISPQLLAGEQRLEFTRNDVLFILDLRSKSELSKRDSIKIDYVVENHSDNAIAILDLDIPGKVPMRPILMPMKYSKVNCIE